MGIINKIKDGSDIQYIKELYDKITELMQMDIN